MGPLDKSIPDPSPRTAEMLTEKDFLHSADVVIQAIEWNNRDLFLPKYYREISDTVKKEEYIRYLYEQFHGKLKLFADRIDDNCDAFDDLLFLQDSIQALFEAFYRKSLPLSSAFPDENAKKRFYDCIRRYVLDDHVQSLVELQAKFPRKLITAEDFMKALGPTPWIHEQPMNVKDMTQDYVDALLKPKEGK